MNISLSADSFDFELCELNVRCPYVKHVGSDWILRRFEDHAKLVRQFNTSPQHVQTKTWYASCGLRICVASIKMSNNVAPVSRWKLVHGFMRDMFVTSMQHYSRSHPATMRYNRMAVGKKNRNIKFITTANMQTDIAWMVPELHIWMRRQTNNRKHHNINIVTKALFAQAKRFFFFCRMCNVYVSGSVHSKRMYQSHKQ